MDFIFGTLATDDLKLLNHRISRRGLQHAHNLSPRDPLPGHPVTITVHVGADIAAGHVACYFTTDGSPPEGSRGVTGNGQVVHLQCTDMIWDTLCWGYLARWTGELPPQPEGTFVRYRIGAWADDGPEYYADWPEVRLTVNQAATAFFGNKPLPDIAAGTLHRGETFVYHVDHFAPPAWAYEAVIYHIFIDRFYPGNGRDWLQTDDLKTFFGGTLWGVIDKLDYIEALSANCIWLSPSFASPSPHGYNATDFHRTEARLGGDEALHRLVEAAHARGIRVLLDLACNHLASAHPYFQAARNDQHSPYREWFIFDDSPNGYRAFFDYPGMPEINVTHPPAREWLLDIARYWLREFDIDGYRLDHANGPGPSFWADFHAACRAVKADSLCFGEVVDAPDYQRRYVGRLDGILDFHLSDALRKTYGFQQVAEADFERFVARHQAYFPDTFVRPTFLDNHDMDRFLFIAGGDRDALRRAAAAQMRLPGPPIIYYGTEVGLGQPTSTREGGLEMARAPMLWGDEQDKALLNFYRELLAARRTARSREATS